MDLERDMFQVQYDSQTINLDAIFTQIRKLGYRPSQVDLDAPEAESPPSESVGEKDELPEPIRSAAIAAREARQLLFLDFYAEWCAPCRTLEETVLGTPEVQKALQNYRFVKVDTDSFPQAATHFGVMAMPTLLLLKADGTELHRQVGPISKSALIELLQSWEG